MSSYIFIFLLLITLLATDSHAYPVALGSGLGRPSSKIATANPDQIPPALDHSSAVNPDEKQPALEANSETSTSNPDLIPPAVSADGSGEESAYVPSFDVNLYVCRVQLMS